MKRAVNFRIEEDLIAKCKAKAASKGQSFTAWMVSVLEVQFKEKK